MSSTTDRSHGLARKHIKGAIEDDERKAGGELSTGAVVKTVDEARKRRGLQMLPHEGARARVDTTTGR